VWCRSNGINAATGRPFQAGEVGDGPARRSPAHRARSQAR
jgi:hypothetical protein